MGYAEDMPENQGGQDHHVRAVAEAVRPGFPRPLRPSDDCYLDLRRAEIRLVTLGRNLRREATFPRQKSQIHS